MLGEASAPVTPTETPVAPVAPVAPVTPEVAPVVFDYVVSDQGLPTVSDADLQGFDDETESQDEAQPEVKSKEESPAEDETPVTPPPKAEAPPKGFVPTAALHEAREENRKLKERISTLEVAGKDVPPIVPPALPADEITVRSDFKVLTKEEFVELSEESPRDALIYQQELMDYREAQRIASDKLRVAEVEKANRDREVNDLFEESAALMAEAVPGIFDEGSTVSKELADFAESIGFTNDLFYLTNPETQVILPGEAKPLFLGRQAAAIMTVLAGLKNKGVPNADATMRAAVEAELRPKIEAEVLSKIKTTGKKAYTALADIPTSAATTPERKILTEVEVAALNPKELEAYLSGA